MRHHSVRVALTSLFAMVLMSFAFALPARAESGYEYTIRVFSGNRGTLAQDPVVMQVEPGASVDLYELAPVTVTDDKYVHTGYRQSGTDKLLGDGKVNGVQRNGVYEDMDFVVAYGVKANTVAYTLRYEEYGTGRQLREPRTYYGTVGDKPVATYEYIEGYRPRYLAITGTLHADEENVWTFEYVPLEEGETVVTTTTNTRTIFNTIPAEEGAAAVVMDGGTTTTGGGTATGGAATAGNANAGQDGEGQRAEGEAAGGATTEAAPETQEILDLDTPLAGPGAGSGAGAAEKGSRLLTNPVAIGGIAAAIIAALGVLIFMANRKKKEQENEEA